MAELAVLGGTDERDLELLATSRIRHAFEKVAFAVGGGLLGLVFAWVLSSRGISDTWRVALFATAGLSTGGFLVPVYRRRESATRLRWQLRQVLRFYLDLVAVLIAGGATSEEALLTAAEGVESPAFEPIRRALGECGPTQRRLEGLNHLAELWGVDDLRAMTASRRLANAPDAHLCVALKGVAASVRVRLEADVQLELSRVPARIAVAVVVQALALEGFIFYPIIARNLGWTS